MYPKDDLYKFVMLNAEADSISYTVPDLSLKADLYSSTEYGQREGGDIRHPHPRPRTSGPTANTRLTSKLIAHLPLRVRQTGR